MKFLFKVTILLFYFLSNSFGQNLNEVPEAYLTFLEAETSNSYIAKDSTVDLKYRADGIKPFKVGFLEIPSSELNLEVSSINPQILEDIYRDWETDRKSTRLNSSH